MLKRRWYVGALLLAVALMWAAGGAAWAQKKAADKPAEKPQMQEQAMDKGKAAEKGWYLVIVPHTAEQCLAALDHVDARGSEELAKWDWGCKSGDHTGYLRVKAASAEEALANVPESERSGARAIGLSKFSQAEIKSFHEMMMKKK